MNKRNLPRGIREQHRGVTVQTGPELDRAIVGLGGRGGTFRKDTGLQSEVYPLNSKRSADTRLLRSCSVGAIGSLSWVLGKCQGVSIRQDSQRPSLMPEPFFLYCFVQDKGSLACLCDNIGNSILIFHSLHEVSVSDRKENSVREAVMKTLPSHRHGNS